MGEFKNCIIKELGSIQKIIKDLDEGYNVDYPTEAELNEIMSTIRKIEITIDVIKVELDGIKLLFSELENRKEIMDGIKDRTQRILARFNSEKVE